ncbi:CRISPR-associated ring nuclease [Methylolobus aquaticus]
MTSILVCTLGGSWAVIPEVYAFLAPERLPLFREHPQGGELAGLRAQYALSAPNEIWVCTTEGDRTLAGLQSLLDWHAGLFEPPALRVWQAAGTDQLGNQSECEQMRELIVRVCLLAHDRAGQGEVVLSLAGGRKTMSADLQWAGSLLGCHALVHVVGCEPMPPELTWGVTVERMLAPLPADWCTKIVPLVVGRGMRSELLDVAADGRGPVTAAVFPIGMPDPRVPLSWPAPVDAWLCRELQQREREGSQLLGNFLSTLADTERHENWRSLYRLPPRVIARLRETPVGPDLRDWLDALPKADLHRHVGGCLNLEEQRIVGRAIWDELTPDKRDRATREVAALLHSPHWPDAWPALLRDGIGSREHRVAALLVKAEDAQLTDNLYGISEPRVALKAAHRLGFAAYERPGELSGSAVLGHPAALEPYAAAVVRGAVAEGLAYAELRGSPQKYGDGLAFLRAFRAALRNAAASLPAARRPLFRFTIIADRRDRKRIKEVVALAVAAKSELGDFIAGIDLAGDEGTTRPEEIAPGFMPAFEACLPVTIHAGEGEKADAIWQAAYHLHADRIGHGLTLGEHPQLATRFRDRGICLELCPTSNREVVGFRDPDVPDSAAFPEYPLAALWRQGLPLTLCTDNPGISRTTLTGEYLAAARMTPDGLRAWDALAMMKQGFVHAFLPSDEKERLLKRADAAVYRAVLDHFGGMA